MRTSRILIVDDEAPIRDGLRELVTGWGYDVQSAPDSEVALELAESYSPEVILSDLMMPGTSGLELMALVREKSPHVAFILLTGHGTIENATQAMREGAYDYLTKPVDLDRLRIVLEKALERVHDRVELVRLTRDLADRGQFGRLVGSSALMRRVYHLIQQGAPSRASVLITGESGTGKELVARTIHDMSPRRDKPFIAVNCAAIPETLLESEILGHEKGSFTGAISARAGCFELANGGTLLLDEIGEMPPELQAKLLRVLEERTLRRVGGRQELPVDVRVLSSTNIDIHQALREGRFREDLFYRLNVFTMALPSLRERPEDIPLLAGLFVEEYARMNDKNVSGVTAAAMEALCRHDWPGNVRELRNVIERAVIVSRHEAIDREDLPHFAVGTSGPVASGLEPPALPGIPPLPELRPTSSPGISQVHVPVGTTVLAAEQLLIVETLRSTNQNKTRAAEILGISTKTLHNKLKLYRRSDS